MSDHADDALFGLYRDEVAAAKALIVNRLTAGNTDWEACEKAARGVRSAALIVGLKPAADRATKLVDRFAATRTGTPFDDQARAEVLTLLEQLDAVPAVDLPAPVVVEASVVAIPPPPPPARPAAPSPTIDASLLDLFREEVRSLCGQLSTGLVELEAAPTDTRRIEPLMRAAHSLKGASRIVHQMTAIDLAHEMEEVLVSAQRGKLTLTQADIDVLLSSTDILATMADADLATWGEAHASATADHVRTLRARLKCESLPPPPPVVAAAVPVATPNVVVPTVEPPSPAPSPSKAADTAQDQVVRISAKSLTRLLSLAGESLVEARWLQPFAQSLLKLKKQQDHLSAVIEDLMATLPAGSPTAALAAEARERLANCRAVLADRIDNFEGHARQSDDLNSRLYREVIASRMRPFSEGTQAFTRMVRDVAKQLGKKVKLDIRGQDTDVDRDILDKLDAPLGHLLRNAVDHGLETPEERRAAGKPEVGTIRLSARHHAGSLQITVADDGRGIDLTKLRAKVVERGLTTADLATRLSDAELLEFLFLPGFSTKEKVSDVSGRGVGLDVVQSMAQAVGGTIRIDSVFGSGTTFEFQLPITLSVVRAVLVSISGEAFAIPLNRTDRLLRLPPDAIRSLEGKPHFENDGRHVGLVPAHQVLDLPAVATESDDLAVVLVDDRTGQFGLVVDGFLGEQDLVVRPLDPRLGQVPNVSAASLLDDGEPVLILDVDDVTRSVTILAQEGKLRHERRRRVAAKRAKRVLVVDDSAIVRETERQLLRSRGYDVDVAVDGVDGWHSIRGGGYDLVVSDIDMPRMTGLELVQTMRADAEFGSLPVVIVSYKDRPEDRRLGMEVGANYYLTKSSFHDGSFLDAVTDLIGPADG
jgi:two-component system sensor histidine kinase and response regulator WspE